jgi:hypothetical protein
MNFSSMETWHAASARISISGTYQREQGRKSVYIYSGAYGVTEAGAWWLVTVRSEGVFKGTPMGLLGTRNFPTRAEISGLIARQIEELDQIVE